MSLVDFCSMSKEIFPMVAQRAPAYSEAARRRKNFAGGSKEKARRVEEEAVLKSIVTPRLIELRRAFPIGRQIEILGRFEQLPRDRYGGWAGVLLGMMPAVKHSIDVYTATGEDSRRKDSMNDFFDRELIMAPLVYSDALVTWDRWIRHILSFESVKRNLEKKSLLWTRETFEEFLDQLPQD